MRTLWPDPPPAEIAAALEARRRSGLHRLDEVWEGVLHVVPAPSGEHADIAQQLAVILDGPARDAGLWPTIGEFNLGDSETDFRVPDGGIHAKRPSGTWFASATLVVEIVSPGDETWEKLPFYSAHQVKELLIIDPRQRTVDWLSRADDGSYRPIERSALIDLSAADLAQRIDWPPAAAAGR
ncbi:MAG TPA: Uma2 family endonuclease [Solirubrobacteraceae bacterium]|jgi:Uma2 family endonuclease|nr:Uma2 family endonuclease [Solirubrobacteraceae bacterium]